VCFKGEQKILYKELKDPELIGGGGYGSVYKAKHKRFGTVVYKELDVKRLGDRYSKIKICSTSACLVASSLFQYQL